MPQLPNASNIPPLAINIEGLRRFANMPILGAANEKPNLDELKLRGWLLHTVATSARHYLKARELVVAQNSADQQRDGGVIFYIWEVYEQLEGAVMATHRVWTAIRNLSEIYPAAKEYSISLSNAISSLAKLRNQFEHAHLQIVKNEMGKGPILITFDSEGGKTIRFRNLSLETGALHSLIEGAYRFVAQLYPDFNVDSPPEAGGPAKLTMSFSIERAQ